MGHSAGLVVLMREYARVLTKRESGNVQCVSTPPLLIWGNGGGVREMRMRTRPCRGGVWGGIRAGFGFWFFDGAGFNNS